MAIIGNIGGFPQMSGDAAASQVLSGKTFYTTNPISKQTGTMQSQAAQTITPTKSVQTIPAGKYLSGAQTIEAIPAVYGRRDFGQVDGSGYSNITINFNYNFTPQYFQITCADGTSFGSVVINVKGSIVTGGAWVASGLVTTNAKGAETASFTVSASVGTITVTAANGQIFAYGATYNWVATEYAAAT